MTYHRNYNIIDWEKGCVEGMEDIELPRIDPVLQSISLIPDYVISIS